jgi:hypothetical protein
MVNMEAISATDPVAHLPTAFGVCSRGPNGFLVVILHLRLGRMTAVYGAAAFQARSVRRER